MGEVLAVIKTREFSVSGMVAVANGDGFWPGKLQSVMGFGSNIYQANARKDGKMKNGIE